MRLGKNIFGFKLRRNEKPKLPTIKVANLKRIVAVSDEYWDALYRPFVDFSESVFRLFGEKYGVELASSYEKQFISVISRAKGMVDDDPLAVHLYNYSLAVAFSNLYMARLLVQFEFYAVSTRKETIGERQRFYPWHNIPDSTSASLKLKKSSYIPPVYTYSVALLSTMLPVVGWKWLLSRPKIHRGLIDAVCSNGEQGGISNYLNISIPSDTHSGKSVEPGIVSEISPLSTKVENDNRLSETPPQGGSAFDDLLSAIGGDTSQEVSMDDLLNGNNKSPTTKATNVKQNDVSNDAEVATAENAETSKSENLDFSMFDNLETDGDVMKSEQQNTVNAGDDGGLLAEFQSLLAGSSTTDSPADSPMLVINDSEPELVSNQLEDLDVKSNNDVEHSFVDEGSVFSEKRTLSSDLMDWCKSMLENPEPDCGVMLASLERGYVIALDIEKAFLSFVRNDFDLDSENQYKNVANEVYKDLLLSSDWIKNKHNGDTEVWEVFTNKGCKKVVLLETDITGVTICASIKRHSVNNGAK